MLQSNITSVYRENPCARFAQGDIFRDLIFIVVGGKGEQIEIKLPYALILSQDCDLEQGFKYIESKPDDSGMINFSQYLPSVLFAPAFQSELFRVGEQFKGLYSINSEKINSEKFKKIKTNDVSRYHYLPSNIDKQVPELIIDFKAYYTISFDFFIDVFKEHYFVSLNELFRERLSQRFANYLNRVGLPSL